MRSHTRLKLARWPLASCLAAVLAMASLPTTAQAGGGRTFAHAAINQYLGGGYGGYRGYGGYGGYGAGFGYRPNYFGAHPAYGFGAYPAYGFGGWSGYGAGYPLYGYNSGFGYHFGGFPAYGYVGGGWY